MSKVEGYKITVLKSGHSYLIKENPYKIPDKHFNYISLHPEEFKVESLIVQEEIKNEG